ncbi:MAG: short-chain dehydrogenase/reductase [Rhodospirillales bacterium]|nr:short-chain dehydrogenase/reductase [Rhodospirillales bacterium]
MDLELTGKRALITGGTRGIGRAIAERLADEGASIAICARNAEQVLETAAALRAQGVQVIGAAVDIADGPALKTWIAKAATELGGLDILVPNASAMVPADSDEDWRQSFAVDIMGTVDTVNGALPFLEKSAAAAIVIIATVSAVETSGAFGVEAYGSMKAALLHYSKSLANALAPKNIRVNAVSPGSIYVKDGFWGKIERDQPTMFDEVLKANPLGRMGRPVEVANAVAFLASSKSSFTTGTNLIVDGGITVRVQY